MLTVTRLEGSSLSTTALHIESDIVWGLLGTAAFAFFCFHFLLDVVVGSTMMGIKKVKIT
ncbi:hypothetical protein LINPERPRIM_LOCUS35617, partial [Linum perenne]